MKKSPESKDSGLFGVLVAIFFALAGSFTIAVITIAIFVVSLCTLGVTFL